MWRKRCLNRQIKIVHSDKKTEYADDIKRTTKKVDKQIIIDINKDIVVYINDNMSKREFRGYHMFESSRCGHFRHLKGGKLTYVPPTIVHSDFYLPDKNIAIECLDVDHFYSYGAADKELKIRQQSDERKYNQYIAHGIKIIYFVSSLISIPEDMSKKHQYITGLSELYNVLR